MYDLTTTYDEKFYTDNTEDSYPIARYLAPFIVDHFNVKRVIDYGCATGHWLGEFHKAGADGLGVEGSSSIISNLLVKPKHVIIHDLRYPVVENTKMKSFLEGGPIDLAFTFEVAEHVEAEYADLLVENILTGNPSWVIMTAAPPGQGGLGHVNEQPKSYWIEKFELHGYKNDLDAYEYLKTLINDGRKKTDATTDLQRPDMLSICPKYKNTQGCEKGVWAPPWLPDNLIILKKK